MPSSLDGGYLSTISYKVTCHLQRPPLSDRICYRQFTYIQTVTLDLPVDVVKCPVSILIYRFAEINMPSFYP